MSKAKLLYLKAQEYLEELDDFFFFFQNISDDKRPKSKLNDIEIESLMGIDSDLTITSRESEIPHWPLQKVSTQFIGIRTSS